MGFGEIIQQKTGIDLGTTNTIVYIKGVRKFTDEPSVVAFEKESKKIVGVGRDAKNMYGREPKDIAITKPLSEGVISSFTATEIMLRYFLKKTKAMKSILKPLILICIPSGVTTVEKKAVEDVAKELGAGKVYTIGEPMSAAIGANIPVEEPKGHMIIDIGGGTTETSVIAVGGVVETTEIRIGGNKLDRSIKEYISRKYKLEIGEETSEKLKIKNATVKKKGTRVNNLVDIRGRDMVTGLPTKITVPGKEIYIAIEKDIEKIVESVKHTFEKTPPELVSDIVETGIVVTGGGAYINGIADLIAKETGVKTRIADIPNYSVILGLKKLLRDDRLFKRIVTDNKTTTS